MRARPRSALTRAPPRPLRADVLGAGAPAVEQITMRMWWANTHAGTIIGQGGSSIKGIREASGCRVQIAEAAAPGAERLVTIVGTPLNINRAVELILDKIDDAGAEAAAHVVGVHVDLLLGRASRHISGRRA